VVLMVDGKAGRTRWTTPSPSTCARRAKPVVLLVNKVDDLGSPTALAHHDFWDLGLGEPQPGEQPERQGERRRARRDRRAASPEGPRRRMRAARGRDRPPNVGKSSLRQPAAGRGAAGGLGGGGYHAGRDRHAVLNYHGRKLVFVDTAGLRRQARIHENVEYYSAIRTERAVESADVCLLLIDADRADPQPGPEDRPEGVGRGVRADPAGEQVGPGGEGDDDGAELREGAAGEGAVPQMGAGRLHQRDYRPAGPADPAADPGGPGGEGAADPTHEVNEVVRELVTRAATARAGTAGKDPLRDAGRYCAADLRPLVEYAGSHSGRVPSIPAERFQGPMGLRRFPDPDRAQAP
jgi:hypothetical protein